MTNILIPTDFTPASVKMAEQAVKLLNRPVNIVLFHAFEMPFYYQDLVRTTPQPYQDLLNDSFRQACKQLKDQYPKLVNKISFKYLQGDTNPLFRNFAEANAIDLIVCPNTYAYTKIHKASVNPINMFRKSRLPIVQELGVLQKNPVNAAKNKELSLAV